MSAALRCPDTYDAFPLQQVSVRIPGLLALQRQLADNLIRYDSDTSQSQSSSALAPSSSVAPCPRHEMYDGADMDTLPPKARTLAEQAPINDLDERGFAQVVSQALRAHYGDMKASAKRVANDSGASVQSAKNWLAGLSAPHAFYLKKLEAKVPALAAEMRRLTAAEADIDPDFQRDFVKLMQTMMRAGQV